MKRRSEPYGESIDTRPGQPARAIVQGLGPACFGANPFSTVVPMDFGGLICLALNAWICRLLNYYYQRHVVA